ncbi:MAG: sigma factor-like helix-turn-helix DNA-binding protein [Pseudobdellovibrio sp.]
MKSTEMFTKEKIERFSENNFEELHDSLLKLPSKMQQAIQMRFFDGLSIGQISHVLGMTWDETDKLIKYTLSELRLMLEEKLDHMPTIQAA